MAGQPPDIGAAPASPLAHEWQGGERWSPAPCTSARGTLHEPTPHHGRVPRQRRGHARRRDDRALKFQIALDDFRLPIQVWVDEGGNFRDESLAIGDGPRLELMADREAMTEAEFRATGEPPAALATFALADCGGKVWNKLTRGVDYGADLAGEGRGGRRGKRLVEPSSASRRPVTRPRAPSASSPASRRTRDERTAVENYERWIAVPDQPQWTAITRSTSAAFTTC